MPLPGSRDYDAVDAGPLPHTTVNNLQDAVVSNLHGELVKFYSPFWFWGPSTGISAASQDINQTETPPGWSNIAGSGQWDAYCALDLPAGCVVTQLDFWWDRAADATASVSGGIVNPAGDFLASETEAALTGDFIQTVTDTAGPDAYLPHTVNGVELPAAGTSDGPAYLFVSSQNDPLVGRIRFNGCWVTYSKPS